MLRVTFFMRQFVFKPQAAIFRKLCYSKYLLFDICAYVGGLVGRHVLLISEGGGGMESFLVGIDVSKELFSVAGIGLTPTLLTIY